MKNFAMTPLLVTLSVTIFLVGCGRKPAEEDIRIQPAESSKDAPNFTLITVDGKTISLSDYKGYVIILDFWATWCGPCVDEIPGLVRIMDDYKGMPVIVIGVSIDQQSRLTNEGMIKFMEKYKVNYPVAFATEQCLYAYGPIRAVPTTYIIDTNGKVRMKIVGSQSTQFFRKVVDKLLAERRPA